MRSAIECTNMHYRNIFWFVYVHIHNQHPYGYILIVSDEGVGGSKINFSFHIFFSSQNRMRGILSPFILTLRVINKNGYDRYFLQNQILILFIALLSLLLTHLFMAETFILCVWHHLRLQYVWTFKRSFYRKNVLFSQEFS